MLIGGDGGFSGVPTYLAQLDRALEGQARITVLSDENHGGYDFVTARGHRHITLPGLRTRLSPLVWMRVVRRLSRLLRDEAPDLVWAHARMGVLKLRLVAIGARLTGRAMPRFAITYHGLPFGPGHRSWAARLSVGVERLLLRLTPAHHIHFLTQAAHDSFLTVIGPAARRHRLHVLHNCSTLGTVARDVPAGRAERVLVMTSRAGFQKNHALAAALMAHLPDSYRLILCGAGTDHSRKRQLYAKQLGPELDRRVAFHGPQKDIRPFLAGADCFLLSSRYEGFPIGALEGFESGLPLATTVIPGTEEILAHHPMTARIDPADLPGSAARIQQVVEGYLADLPASRTRITQAWRAEFSFEHWADEMRKLFTGMLRRP